MELRAPPGTGGGRGGCVVKRMRRTLSKYVIPSVGLESLSEGLTRRLITVELNVSVTPSVRITAQELG